MTNRKLRYSGLGLIVLAAGAMAACGSDSSTPDATAGSSSGGAHAGTGGAAAGAPAAGTGAGGSAAGAGPTGGTGGGAGTACQGTIPSAALITDFSNLMPNAAMPGQYTFTGGVMGGTLSYQANALTLDTVGGTALNVKGTIKDYDGFGIYFNTCYDASVYTGVSFNIKGNVGPTGKLTLRVQTNSNTAATAAKGTCVPSSTTNTYPDCHGATFDITVPPAGGVVTVMFTQPMGGVPIATVNPKEIVGLEWGFAWTAPPAGGAGAGAGGASGGSAGAASGGIGGAFGGASGSSGSGGSGGAKGGAGGAAGAAGAKGGAGGTSGAGGGSAGASAGAGGGAPADGSYVADVTVDDIMFIGGPAGGAGGGSSMAGASSGGASAAGASTGGASTAGAGAGGASAGAAGAKGGSAGTAGG